MREYLKLMRVKHYIKNLLVFIPLVFSKNLFDFLLLNKTFFAFISFSLLASVVYIINDIKDIENDKKHSLKKKRPIASGAISIKKAVILASFLVLIVLVINYLLVSSITSYAILLTYLGLNILYSLGMKNIPIVDIAILALGFLLRISYGSSITGIVISNWLYLTIISFSFFMVLGKRRNEVLQETETREVLKSYGHAFLDKNMYMYLALTIAFYALWCVDTQTILSYGRRIIYSIPLVMVICLKYSLIVEGNSSGDPVEVLLSDKVLLLLVLCYAGLMFTLIYY